MQTYKSVLNNTMSSFNKVLYFSVFYSNCSYTNTFLLFEFTVHIRCEDHSIDLNFHKPNNMVHFCALRKL